MLMCMCMLNRRLQILIDKDLWNKLSKTSKSQNISVGAYIRRAVNEYFEAHKAEVKENRKSPFKGFFRPGKNK